MDPAIANRVGGNVRLGWRGLLPWVIFGGLWGHRGLIRQFVRREIEERYRGSVLGIFWSLLNPLLMLAVYTVVFGFIFSAKFRDDDSQLQFALALFCGLNLFHFLAENISRAPTLILNQPNFVKKVVFPLEILPVTALFGSFFHLVIANIPLFIGLLWYQAGISWTAIFLVVYLVPLALIALGLSWFLAGLGVFLRDIRVLVGPLTLMLMYASGIFYRIDDPHIPEEIRWVLVLNPLAQIIHESRNAVIYGQLPQWDIWLAVTALGLVLSVGGYWFFMKIKRWFADVM